MTRLYRSLVLTAALVVAAGCKSGGGGEDEFVAPGSPPAAEESREFRAIAGISMGAYGALNIGSKHPELFGTIASLGGPVDMTELLRQIEQDGLEVKAQVEIPEEVGDDFTFDHAPSYPDRGTRMTMLQDLVLAFGNPFLHHADPARQYLASDSEPARLLVDDAFGQFQLLPDPRGFLDGGDDNRDGLRQTDEIPNKPTDVLLLASGAPETIGVELGGRSLVDLDDDGVFDVGDGIVVNFSEPFADTNANGVLDASEVFADSGLDGVTGSGDFGEGNGVFDYDPDRANWLAEDPLSRIAARSAADLSTQRLYMDVGVRDEFGLALHYDNLVEVLRSKGLVVGERDGFSEDCDDLPDPDEQFLLVRYDEGHIGVESVDPDDLIDGNPCGDDTVWQRFLSMLGFLDESFPDGVYGSGDDDDFDFDFDFDGIDDIDDIDLDIDFPDFELRGDVSSFRVASPSLQTGAGATVTREVVVYRPPAFFNTDDSLPVVYFLGGHGQEPDDFVRVGDLLDLLINIGELQNMVFVFLPGQGGREGSFYVNHVVPEAQAPEILAPTSGRYEDSILVDLIPAIEDQVLDGRVRQ